MAKKSKKTAARYSELSKKKRKKQPDQAPVAPEPAVAAPRETARPQAEARPAPRPAPRAAPRAQADTKRGLPNYDHVRGDLRKIGMLAGGMLLVLIILAFVLG
jgi:hypothetical protein